jgi:hypothetical protein
VVNMPFVRALQDGRAATGMGDELFSASRASTLVESMSSNVDGSGSGSTKAKPYSIWPGLELQRALRVFFSISNLPVSIPLVSLSMRDGTSNGTGQTRVSVPASDSPLSVTVNQPEHVPQSTPVSDSTGALSSNSSPIYHNRRTVVTQPWSLPWLLPTLSKQCKKRLHIFWPSCDMTTLVTVISVVLAVPVLVLTVYMYRLSQWTAWKDFRQVCLSQNVSWYDNVPQVEADHFRFR